MKELVLTNDGVSFVDDDIYEKIIKYNWRKDSLANHVVCTIGKKGNRRLLRLHRYVMDAKPGQLVDHINGNVLDNRRENLRIADKSKNGMNRGSQKNNKFGVKGVSYHKAAKKWHAQLMVNGKKALSSFHENIDDAKKAYNEAAIKFHGEFARINEI